MAKYTPLTVLERLNEIHKKLLGINKYDFAQDDIWHALDRIETELDAILQDGYDDYGKEKPISARYRPYGSAQYSDTGNTLDDAEEYEERKLRNQKNFIYDKWNALDSSLREYIDKFTLLGREQQIRTKNEKQEKNFYFNKEAWVADNMTIGSINFKIEEMDRMIKEVDQEPHLSVDQKEMMKTKFTKAKEALKSVAEEGTKYAGMFTGGLLKSFFAK